MIPPDEPSTHPVGATPSEIPKRIVRWVVILGVIGVIALAYLVIIPPQRAALVDRVNRAQAQAITGQLAAALKQYHVEYGRGLTVNTNAIVMGTLQGGNPRRVIFFDPAAVPKSFDFLNAEGELVDPWGTPYSFDLSDPQNPRIWSSGKDRQNNGGEAGSDDIPNWR